MDDDAELVYTTYVSEHWRDLVRAAIFLGAGPHEAEDLAQATLVRCYDKWDRVSGADNRDAYVYRMLLNQLRDSRRSRWWRGRADHEIDGSINDSSDAVATADAIHRALGALPKGHQEVVVLRYFVQLTEAQAADVLGVARGTVKSRLSRALARLAADQHLIDLGGSR
jgi:RNA polymerase sigma-70 factor (sigma-E family)